jgi:predicted acyltransferase
MSQSSERLESLDQFRGYTVAGMFLVNFLGSYALVTQLFPNLKHHNTFCSYADTIMPQFFFAVGFGFRLTLLKRLQRDGWWPAYARVLQRILGLLFIAMFVHGLDGNYKSWSELQAAGWWEVIRSAFGRNYFQTLTHIALASLWVTPVIAASGWVRALYFLFSAGLHILISYMGFYQWVHEYRGIDGGYFGFISWALVVLTGSFAYDIVLGDRNDDSKNAMPSERFETARQIVAADGRQSKMLWHLFSWSFGLMLAGYGLSCLNRLTMPNQELWKQGWLTIFNTPPFVLPTAPVNLWTMSQRAGSVSYMVFASGFSMFVFAVAVLLADVWRLRMGWFRTLGVNALAAYVLHFWVNDVVNAFVPKDSPVLFALVGFSMSFLACYVMLRSFEKQKIFFRI